METAILDAIQEHLATPAGDVLMPIVTSLGNVGLVWILMGIILLCFKKYRKSGAIVLLALVLDFIICNVLLKNLVARARPFEGKEIALLIARPLDYSFPSGHTAAAFAAVSALKAGGTGLWIPTAVLAALIAFSRMYLYVHYPTDILGGLIIGIFCGCAAAAIYKKTDEKRRKKCG